MVRRVDGAELVLELSHQLLGLGLGALLPRFHGQDEADVRLRDARVGDALGGQAEHLNLLLVVREPNKVHDILPLRPPRVGDALAPLLPQLRLVQRVEVGVLKVLHLLAADVGEEGDVGPHLPSLVDAEQRQEAEGREDVAVEPQARRQGHQGHADADGHDLPGRIERHAHVDDLQLLGPRGLRLPDLVLVDDPQDALVQVDGVRVGRQQGGVEARGVRRREDSALGPDVEDADQAHHEGDREERDARVVHGLPRPEEEDVLSGRQSLAGHEHRGDDEAAREHLHARAHREQGHGVGDDREDSDPLGDRRLEDLVQGEPLHERHDDLGEEVEERLQEADEHGHRDGLGDVAKGHEADRVEGDGEEDDPDDHVAGEALVGQKVVAHLHNLLHGEVLEVSRDRLGLRDVHAEHAHDADQGRGDVPPREALVENAEGEEEVHEHHEGLDGQGRGLRSVLEREHVHRTPRHVEDHAQPEEGVPKELRPARLRVRRPQLVQHELVLSLLLEDQAHALQRRPGDGEHRAQEPAVVEEDVPDVEW
mmetsp:Transcript_50552/g.149073  ORF Transcript_50552/g.149073 Transcript_50552/m.149073 type:complete len:538 (+) Transcript_50552:1347-2960(+)